MHHKTMPLLSKMLFIMMMENYIFINLVQNVLNTWISNKYIHTKIICLYSQYIINQLNYSAL